MTFGKEHRKTIKELKEYEASDKKSDKKAFLELFRKNLKLGTPNKLMFADKWEAFSK
jgi:hypothetical protein